MNKKKGIIAEAWKSGTFKKKLIEFPKETLLDSGILIPSNVEVRVVENSNNKIYLVLVPPPSAELSEEHLELHKAQGGKAHFGLSDIVEKTVFKLNK